MTDDLPPAPQLTDRDLAILRLLAEHRKLCALHVAALLGVRPRTAQARVRRLAGLGMLVRQRIHGGHADACWITREGLNAVGSRLPEPKPDLTAYRHDLGVGWLWLAAGRGAFGAVTEFHGDREMRSHDQRRDRTGRALGVGLGFPGPKGYEQRHYPDLVMTLGSGHRVAIELELTVKSRRRLDGIMRGYAADRRFDAVIYLTDDPAVRTAIEGAASRTGIPDIIHVQDLAPLSSHGVAPTQERAAARSGRGRDSGREAS